MENHRWETINGFPSMVFQNKRPNVGPSHASLTQKYIYLLSAAGLYMYVHLWFAHTKCANSVEEEQ